MRAALAILACVIGPVCAFGQNQFLEFDGNDLVIIPNSASLNPAQLTIECRVKFARLSSGDGYSGTDNQVLMEKGSDIAAGQYHLAQLGLGTGNTRALTFYVDYRQGAGAFKPLYVGQWHHLAGTYDGSMATLYLDGEPVGSKDIGPQSVGNGEPLYLSFNDVGGFEFHLTGAMDDVRVWDHARTGEQIRSTIATPLTGAEAGLVGCWEFEEPVDSQTVRDLSPFGNDGQLGWTPGVDTGDPARVPEPATLSVMALGAAASAAARRARRRRSAR